MVVLQAQFFAPRPTRACEPPFPTGALLFTALRHRQRASAGLRIVSYDNDAYGRRSAHAAALLIALAQA